MEAIPGVNAIQWCKPPKAVVAHFTSNRIFIIQCHIMYYRLLWRRHTFQIMGALLSSATFFITDIHALQIIGTVLSRPNILHYRCTHFTNNRNSIIPHYILHYRCMHFTNNRNSIIQCHIQHHRQRLSVNQKDSMNCRKQVTLTG